MDNLTPHKAAEYDQKVRQTIPFYETIHSEVIRLVKVVKPEVKCWIDTGCGTGCLVEQALGAFPETRFILADPAEAMLVQTRRRLAAVPKSRVVILPPIQSAELPSCVEPAQADVVTAIQCHHYLQVEGRLNALRGCFEMLKPGSLFVTFENVAPRTAAGVCFGLSGWKTFLLAQGRTEDEVDKHLARYGTEFFPITVEQHLQALSQTGFRVVELFWYSQMQAGFYAIR
jgi:tRNA (cmo5U34)-methyltransferase